MGIGDQTHATVRETNVLTYEPAAQPFILVIGAMYKFQTLMQKN